MAALLLSGVLSSCQPNRFTSGWIPYWGGTSGRAIIDNPDIASLYAEVSMLWYGTAPDGTLPLIGTSSGLASTVASARAQGLAVIPTIFDSSPAGTMRAILADPFSRANHAQHIVDLVNAKGYDGIDLDYEVFAFGDGRTKWDEIRPNWILFIHTLSGLMHTSGKILSVTVPPVWDNGASGYTVYAQDQIAPDIDRLRLMVYDWSTSSPGPIAPLSWVSSVISYSSAHVPVSKLQLGVPTYGRHWTTQKNSGEICPDGAVTRDSITMKEGAQLAAQHGLTPTRHSSGELTFSWDQVVTGPRTKPLTPPIWTPPPKHTDVVNTPTDPNGLQPALRLSPPSVSVTCTLRHIAYYPDEYSVRQRAEAALAAHWSGIIIFATGYENTAVYTQLAALAYQRPNGDPSGSFDTPTVSGSTLRVTGLALDPEFDLSVPVRITVTPSGGGAAVATRTVLASVERADAPAPLGPFHGFDQSFFLTPGAYQVCGNVMAWGGASGPALACRQIVVPAGA